MQSKAMQSKATQRNAEQSNAKQSIAKQRQARKYPIGVALGSFLKGYFDKPLPPEERPGPPATFRRRIFLHLPSGAIFFLDLHFWDVSKPFLLAQIPEPAYPKSPNLAI